MNAQETSPELKEIQAKLIGYAMQVADGYGLNEKLDYSDESIKTVEEILSNINSEYVKNQNEDGLYGLAMEFGFYIMAVIEKNHGPAYYERDHKDYGENTFPFYWRKSTMFPVAWCLKRILDGEGDNVWLKYKIFILDKKE